MSLKIDNPPIYVALEYVYVDDVREKRAPLREGHLELIKQFAAANELAMAGAYSLEPESHALTPTAAAAGVTLPPPSAPASSPGALIVFAPRAASDEGDARQQIVDRFLAKDPYIAGGIVKSYSLRSWTVIVGGERAKSE